MAATGTLKIAVFVDGGFFQQVFAYYLLHQRRRLPLSLGGIMAWLRAETARRCQREVTACQFVDMFCLKAGSGSAADGTSAVEPQVDQMLRREGFCLLNAPADAGPRGGEVHFALEVLDRVSLRKPDVVALFTANACYVTLVRKVAACGAAVLVPSFDIQLPDSRGGVRRIKTAAGLYEDATYTVALGRLIEEAGDDTPVLRALFGLPAPVREERSSRRQPAAAVVVAAPAGAAEAPAAEAPAAPAPAVPSAPEPEAPDGPLAGTIAEIRERMGFVLEDWNRKKLFFHKSSLAEGTLADLKSGDRVEYLRGSDPKNRPCAIGVRRTGGRVELPAPAAAADPTPPQAETVASAAEPPTDPEAIAVPDPAAAPAAPAAEEQKAE